MWVMAVSVTQAKEYIEQGMDVNELNREGTAPLHAAAQYCCAHVARVLIAHGAQVNVKDKLGRTPLILSAAKGYLPVVKLLLESKADVHFSDLHQWTALDYGASNGHLSTVRMLLEHGADPNVGAGGRGTPLHRAAEKGYLTIIVELLMKGALAEAREEQGLTALGVAKRCGQQGVIEVLTAHAQPCKVMDPKTELPLEELVSHVENRPLSYEVHFESVLEVVCQEIKWEEFGQALGMSLTLLEDIKVPRKALAYLCQQEMVGIWLKGFEDAPCLPSWRVLVSALLHPSVSSPDLARKVALRHLL